jgi:hypothetical protein
MVTFLTLSKDTRERIYKTVLNLPHPAFIFQGQGSKVEIFAPDRPTYWLVLLYINHQISSEASETLYSVNHFELVDITQRQSSLLRSFLDSIRLMNAASLSHLCINLPVVESIDGQSGNIKLRDDSLQSVKLLQDRCTNLSTLETLVHSKSPVSSRRQNLFFVWHFHHLIRS